MSGNQFVPMSVRLDNGRIFAYLVDERATVGDSVMVPETYFRGPELGIIVATESSYDGPLKHARWNRLTV